MSGEFIEPARGNIRTEKSFEIKKDMARFLHLIIYILMAQATWAQVSVRENAQHAFPHSIPAGNYSGIAWMGSNRYAVVSDKADIDGFFVFEIDIDSVSGEIKDARNLGFHASGLPNRDEEGIAFNPERQTLLISGEADNRILEYRLDGTLTGREATLPEIYRHLPPNLGLEALTYNAHTHQLWTCNEGAPIMVQAFDSLYRPLEAYPYPLDKPQTNAEKALHYAHGVGAMCAMDDGSLLLLEREFFVPKAKLGAVVYCKLYRFVPGREGKTLLADWKTNLSLFSRSLANYEGMCLGPTLSDGSRVILLVADSQNRYAGVLKDWLKTLRLRVPQL